jgi:cytochrome c
MKNVSLIIVALALGILSCGQKEKKTTAEDYGTPAEEAVATKQVDPIAQGEMLVKENDCKTCHHKTNKIIGPAHLDVAKKYEFTEANVKMLASKIIKGGQGNWGQIPMAEHSDISQAEAEMMARYVLSLDGEKEH